VKNQPAPVFRYETATWEEKTAGFTATAALIAWPAGSSARAMALSTVLVFETPLLSAVA
jgi:hypothetical protein